MDAFSFVFSLFGLLLGLSLAEVLSGFSRTLRLRHAVRIGPLTPLLGLFVMLNVTSFWDAAWNARHWMAPSYGWLVFGLGVTSIYYLAASLVFPADPERWPNFDEYYWKHRRQVIIAIAFCNALAFGLFDIIEAAEIPALLWVVIAAFNLLAAILFFSRSKATNITALSLLNGLYALLAITSLGLS
jgi:hypothetical protein